MAAIDWSQYKEEPRETDWSQYKEPSQDQPSTWESLYKGVSEAYPRTLKSGANAIAKPLGMQGFQEDQELPAKNWIENIGRGAGKVGGALTLAAPFAAAGAAALPIAGAELGAGIGGYLTTQGDWKERLKHAVIDSLVPIAGKGIAAGTRLTKSLLTSVKPRTAADIIQGAHDIAHAKAIAPLNEAATEAAKRNISPIKLPKQVTKLINEKGVFSKTPANKRLLENATKGDHQSIMDLQSDMFKKSQQLLQPTKSTADNNLGEELEAARDLVKDTMQTHYTKEDSADLADKVRKGMSAYRGVKELFHENPVISKLVGKEKIVPDNLVKQISKDTAYHAKLRKALPELNKVIQHQKDKAFLKKWGITSAIGLEGWDKVKKIMIDEHDEQ